jgi:CubicO group peptidase (beta-lactamase class C family)
VSLGWYEGALLRRVDPEGRSLGGRSPRTSRRPLGLEVYFGLPSDFEERRLARIERTSLRGLVLGARDLPPRMALAMANPRSLSARDVRQPAAAHAGRAGTGASTATSSSPAGGVIAEARGIAHAYSAFAARDERLGLGDATLDLITAPPTAPRDGWDDVVLKVPTAFSLGFARPHGPFRFGTSGRAFGHPGAGGSFAFADPDREVSFAYVMNRMGFHLNDDPAREGGARRAVPVSVRNARWPRCT